ncbi:hypothetical protein [Pseudomonas canadensis]|uniref:hypothetical protein n=1 Tax=Pseudomonas canadensis TaxID=915099 RepID=UPI002736371E|nr:hypothetical protein [Pseudomonas canadensis]WLH32665.1 hypothetical protein PSH56_13350 [Pseudomonas canadensis]
MSSNYEKMAEEIQGLKREIQELNTRLNEESSQRVVSAEALLQRFREQQPHSPR